MNVFVFYVLNGWYTIDGKALLFSSKISYFFLLLKSVSLDTFSLLSVSLTVSIKSTVQNRNLHSFPNDCSNTTGNKKNIKRLSRQ